MLSRLSDIAGVGVWTWSRQEGLVGWSQQLSQIFGGADVPAPTTFETFLDRVHPSDRDKVRTALWATLPREGRFELEHRIVWPDGEVRWVHGWGRAKVVDGLVVLAMGSLMDVTETRRVSGELARTRDLFAGVLETATEQTIIGLDPSGVITIFNTGAEKMLGYSAAEMIGKNRILEVHDREQVHQRAKVAGVVPDFKVIVGRAQLAEPEMRDWTYITRDGTRKQVMLTVTAMRGLDGQINGYLKVGTDITAQVNAERALAMTEALFEEVFDNAGTGILLMAMDGAATGHIVRVNPALCRITGYPQEQLIGMKLSDLVHPEHQGLVAKALEDMQSGRVQMNSGERHWLNAGGHDVWVQISTTTVKHEAAKFMVCMTEDITDRKEAEARLSYMALHDGLTGLPNRSLLLDRVEHALAAAVRSKESVALYYLDLDGFKSVNDQAGHLAGDEVLKMVAQRLAQHVRPGDTVARLGGDEFVVLCPDFPVGSDPRVLAPRLLKLLAEPYPWNGRLFRLSASIGVAVATQGGTAQDLFRRADVAMYIAKDNGKNRVHHSGDLAPRSSGGSLAERHLQIESELDSALLRSEFVLHGQPVLSLATGNVVAVEMLIRWQHPSRGLLPPGEFLEVAENSPLMNRLGRWVLQEACRIAADLPVQPNGRLPDVFVNISGRQLESGLLRQDVWDALNGAQIPADRLVLELTETTTPLINGSLLGDIEAMREEGIRFAIDDIGTGYSSLARLTELPVDILKIDRSFVARIGQNDTVDAVVRAIISLASGLHLQVVAEGVETSQQEAHLQKLGCHVVQGFRYCAARPEPELPGLVGGDLLAASRLARN